ncbi:hypothetical protein LshimejAT787_0410150 [Lyophyllum shimeji]|uniref:Uncharacterized protein n=1 Tax=Lyophyllum shimeji TaxID=47721 RepID=A0A9P3PM53_LYOSH|nr:hypothetical protein LshimejAT787_0410150 [Lyophyllum shimeji]
MASPVASTSSVTTTRKASKNPGLALRLAQEVSEASSSGPSLKLRRLSPVHSLSNTPELEPDWDNDDSACESGDEDGAQYVYIAADSPFYRGPSSPRTSSYLALNGYPFACDALAEEEPLFSPRALFDDDPGSELEDSTGVVIVDADSAHDMDSRSTSEWNLIEVKRPLDQVKRAPTTVEREDSEASRHYF